jgi:hypothetical protein
MKTVELNQKEITIIIRALYCKIGRINQKIKNKSTKPLTIEQLRVEILKIERTEFENLLNEFLKIDQHENK